MKPVIIGVPATAAVPVTAGASAVVGGPPLSGGLVGHVRERMAHEGAPGTAAAVVAAVRDRPEAAVLGDPALLRLADQVYADLVGSGPLAPLLADPQVTDVLVNGDQVWVDRGAGLQRTPVAVGGPEQVRRLAQRLAAAASPTALGCTLCCHRWPSPGPISRCGPSGRVRSAWPTWWRPGL
jgi:hypothetical protein